MPEHRAMVRQLDPGDYVEHWGATVVRVDVDDHDDATVHLKDGRAVTARATAWVTVTSEPLRFG